MKKILVPIDFSELSENATNYAVELAKRTQSELILMNVFYVSLFANNEAMMLLTAPEIEKENIENLEKIKRTILKKNSDLKVTYCYIQGTPVDEINQYASQHKIDLIVIGAQGKGYVQQRVFGSTATTLIRSASKTILVINKNVKFKKPKKIVLAVDYAETDNKNLLKPLKQFVRSFNSYVFVLNVFSESHVPPTYVKGNFQLARALKDVSHDFFITENDEVVAGINAFIKQNEIQMLVMIARSHSIISRIFHEPHTKQMAFQSEVPLLVIHEQTI